MKNCYATFAKMSVNQFYSANMSPTHLTLSHYNKKCVLYEKIERD